MAAYPVCLNFCICFDFLACPLSSYFCLSAVFLLFSAALGPVSNVVTVSVDENVHSSDIDIDGSLHE